MSIMSNKKERIRKRKVDKGDKKRERRKERIWGLKEGKGVTGLRCQ